LAPESLAREGFVHCSYADQLLETLREHFALPRALVVLELDTGRLGRALCVEASRGGALFPHVYAPIAPQQVLAATRIERTGERWEASDLGALGAHGAPGAEAD
jgi:uncharacterized protein (DUF952 family)